MKNWNCEWEVFGCVNFQCAKQCLFFCFNLTFLGVLKIKIKINGSNRPNNRMNNQRHKTNNKLYLFIFLPLRLLNYRRWRAAAAQCSALWHCCGWLHSHVYGGFWLTKCHSSKLRRRDAAPNPIFSIERHVVSTKRISYICWLPSELTLLNSVRRDSSDFVVDNWRASSKVELVEWNMKGCLAMMVRGGMRERN